LFFQCNLPATVWATANPPILINNIPVKQDGIQLTISSLISSSPSEGLLCKTLFTLWYIWKARNANGFQRKTWTPPQVHQAATAHMHSHLGALSEQQSNTEANKIPLRSNRQGTSSPSVGTNDVDATDSNGVVAATDTPQGMNSLNADNNQAIDGQMGRPALARP
jgi:hypothetical protein